VNLPYFISRKLAKSTDRKFSGLILKTAITAVALSVAVMIIAVAMVSGFEKEIKNKVFGFFGHAHITQFDSNDMYDPKPIKDSRDLRLKINAVNGVKHIHSYLLKSTVLKTDEQNEGLVLKGVGPDYDWTRFTNFIKQGEALEISDSLKSKGIVVSETTARRLNLELGEKVLCYFVQQPVRVRPYTITGIYSTGLIEYDKVYAIVDIRDLQKLNNWDADQVAGYEVFLNSSKPDAIQETTDNIYFNALGPELRARTMMQVAPAIFDWIKLQDVNDTVIITIMGIIAAINMITVLLILILERVNMIGILKALGMQNSKIRAVFLYQAGYIILTGLIIGNIIGIGICLLQKHFGFITLPEESYYLSVAPVDLSAISILLINLFSIGLCLLILIVPSFLVNRISPVRAIRFD